MKDLNMPVHELIDESIRNEIISLKREISSKDYEIAKLKETIQDLKKKGYWLLTKQIQIITAFKELDDDSCFYIDPDDKRTFE